MPDSITSTAPAGQAWLIKLAGRGRYRFVLSDTWEVAPNPALLQIKIPDATPGIIARYALDDEQALLALIRYNRLIDTFTGVTCYSLQNHLRTSVPEIGQIEVDELYVGLDRRGAHDLPEHHRFRMIPTTGRKTASEPISPDLARRPDRLAMQHLRRGTTTTLNRVFFP